LRLLIIGVGNLAASVVQAVEDMNREGTITSPSVPHLRWEEVRIVGALDVDRKKVGLKLSQALFVPPNVASSTGKLRAT
jgi:Myo-inositol-1-phosphate synthase